MGETYTITQRQRLMELNADFFTLETTFESAAERNEYFLSFEAQLVKAHRDKINHLLRVEHKTLAKQVEERLETWLTEKEDYTRVSTPAIISAQMLHKMSITKDNPLSEQVFWLDQKHCLRPMLAPNLYVVMRDLHKITREPVRIFEVGSCFRKESQGSQHLNEFTMLNLVDLAGVEDGKQMEHLKRIGQSAMAAIGIEQYEMVVEKSAVYGETLDIVVDGVELASGAYGPHPLLDPQWEVYDTWVGIGFGIERIALVLGQYQSIKRVGKSITYLDGSPLKL